MPKLKMILLIALFNFVYFLSAFNAFCIGKIEGAEETCKKTCFALEFSDWELLKDGECDCPE